jgi:hypothetical protein
MKETALLEVLRTSSGVKRVLERYFDFISLPPANSSFFQLSNTVFEQVGRNGSGGQLVLCDAGRFSSRPLLYVSSEGRAGIIGRSLESGLATIIDLPWVDCLHFSGGGQLAEMRRVVPLAEEDLVEHKPDIMSTRQNLRMRLGISQLPDPVQELHAALTELSPLFPVYAPDGSQYERLGGRFTVMSNGGWRRRLMQQ